MGESDMKRPKRGSLARRLTWAFASIAGALLLVVGLVLTAVSYNAQVRQVVARQQKTAGEAALVTAGYLTQAQNTLTLHGRIGTFKSLLLRSLEVQEQELRSILSSYEGLFEELVLLDENGNEVSRVSRYHTFLPEELGAQADSPAFQQAVQGQMYVADQIKISPYSSLPVIVMAVPVRGGGISGVLQASVNVKGMWDAMADVEVGRTGYAYLVNRDTGQLIAHSDLSRYFRFEAQTLEDVPIVRQLMAGRADLDPQYQGLEGERVIGAAAPLPDTAWDLIVELPTDEALADVRNQIYLLGLLVVVGALVAGSLGLVIPRRIVRPLLALQEGVREFSAGRLDHVVEVRTGDEIQDLAESFNQMAQNLRTSRAELERWTQELEGRVEARTRELAETTEQMRRRAVQLQASGEVAHAIASVRDLDELLTDVTRLISERFGWYHVGIFLVDDQGEYAVLHAANSRGGRRMLERGHRLQVGQVGIVGSVTGSGEPRIALDVGEDAVYFDNPDLPETRSEMALPLMVGDRVIGALDVQSREAAAYDEEDVLILSNLADQVAVAIENARLFEQTQRALEEVQKLHRQYVTREWTGVTEREQDLVYEYRRAGLPPLADLVPPEMELALSQRDVVALSDLAELDGDNGHGDGTARAALAAPIKLRDEVIGVLDLQEADAPRQWTDDEVALVRAISDQVALALENARLLEAEQQQRQAAEALREAAIVLSSTLEFDQLMQTILDQIARVIPSDARNLMLVEGDQVQVVNSMGYERFGAQELLHDLRLPIDQMVTIRQMKETGRPVVISDTVGYPGWSVLPELGWLRSYVGAPIIARGELVGLLNVDSATAGFFQEEHADQLAAFAAQASIAIENTQLVEETSRRAEQLATLNRIGLAITSALDLNEVLNALYERIRAILHMRTFYVALYDESSGLVEFPLFVEGNQAVDVEPRNVREQPGLTGHIIETREPHYIPDTDSEAEEDAQLNIVIGEEHTRSFLGVPLMARGEVLGVLSVQSAEPNAYSEAELELLTTIATQASIAIQNARAYERLVETAEELREIDRLKTQFLANMSHELRTPLNSIIGFSRVMLKGIDGPLTDLQEADLNSIYNSGQHLLGLINSILDMSKIEAGKMDLSFAELDLDSTFRGVLSTTRALVKDEPIELRTEIPKDLPTVWADSQRVRQVLLNLMSNAAKFTNEGHITLRAEVGDEHVTISVEDSGVGIEPEAQERLFIAFQQVDGSTTRRAQGTGLGLAISRSFVELMGGEIWVESAPGEGSTFSFTLPIYQVMREREERETGIELDPHKKAILAVDDDAGVISLLKRYVENEGYQVIGVMQSPHALDTARRLAPDLAAITLDVVMPNMDGWQVLRALKQDPNTKNIPVILCSIVEGLDQGLRLGADACLRKPVTRDEVLDTLRKLERVA